MAEHLTMSEGSRFESWLRPLKEISLLLKFNEAFSQIKNCNIAFLFQMAIMFAHNCGRKRFAKLIIYTQTFMGMVTSGGARIFLGANWVLGDQPKTIVLKLNRNMYLFILFIIYLKSDPIYLEIV